MSSSHRYFIVNKPFNMHSQFIGAEGGMMLGDLKFDFPLGTHCIGRLDSTSEGLLILTTNKQMTQLLFKSARPHKRTYLIQVYKNISPQALHQLREGVLIKVTDQGIYKTAPCQVTVVEKPADLFESGWQYPDHIPSTWLEITLTEGKFRQIRKMMSAVNHRCLRLIRISIESLTLGTLQPFEVQEISEEEIFQKLGFS
ncbi:pseudouridine synthase [Runella zeae]|uniref:pseudouridine synthase n=1 Tax=Runella zeae TaxID=94255 RepID=UPI00048DAF4F|nr:pseudouridine synthase [Runella zeae]